MTKEGLAVNATFLVAEMRKEISRSNNGEGQCRLHHQREEDAAVFKKPVRGLVLFSVQVWSIQ
jgi:hypothetical protein